MAESWVKAIIVTGCNSQDRLKLKVDVNFILAPARRKVMSYIDLGRYLLLFCLNVSFVRINVKRKKNAIYLHETRECHR